MGSRKSSGINWVKNSIWLDDLARMAALQSDSGVRKTIVRIESSTSDPLPNLPLINPSLYISGPEQAHWGMESGTLPLGSNRAPRPCHILNSSGSILPSGFTLFLSRRTTCARGEPVVPACEQLWWAQREIPFGSLKTRFLQPLPSPTPPWPLPSAQRVGCSECAEERGKDLAFGISGLKRGGFK